MGKEMVKEIAILDSAFTNDVNSASLREENADRRR